MGSRLILLLTITFILVSSIFVYACGRIEGEAVGERVLISGGVEG